MKSEWMSMCLMFEKDERAQWMFGWELMMLRRTEEDGVEGVFMQKLKGLRSGEKTIPSRSHRLEPAIVYTLRGLSHSPPLDSSQQTTHICSVHVFTPDLLDPRDRPIAHRPAALPRSTHTFWKNLSVFITIRTRRPCRGNVSSS
jgi:hypothetical protein